LLVALAGVLAGEQVQIPKSGATRKWPGWSFRSRRGYRSGTLLKGAGGILALAAAAGPQSVFDSSALRTTEDWIRARELRLFVSPNAFLPEQPFTDVRNPRWFEETGVPLDPKGVPFHRFVILTKGRVEVAFDFCAECHTRVMPVRKVVRGPQGNFPFGKSAPANRERQEIIARRIPREAFCGSF
jgi:hypothetical protein